MKTKNSNRFSIVTQWALVLAVLVVPQVTQAKTWQATAGAQSNDLGRQALAFLPNEVWIHAGDEITWRFPTEEIHTVTFLKQDTNPQQIRPARPGVGGGCPGTTSDGSNFTGSTCVTSSELVSGQTYTVKFPAAGNFKVVCLVHANMTGAVHVLDPSAPLPDDQRSLDFLAKRQAGTLLADGAALTGQAVATAEQSGANAVSAGIGEVVATGGGSNTLSVLRFLRDSIVVHVGDTVEWTNLDPVTPHTITFGTEPASPQTQVGLSSPDADGARRAIIASASDSVSSGFIQASSQDRTGLAQVALGVTRFRVTFNTPGTFNYICALHDEEGMVGKVIVRP
jgi:plastocyanin